MIALRCPRCQKALDACDREAGQTLVCLNCGEPLLIPALAPTPDKIVVAKVLSKAAGNDSLPKTCSELMSAIPRWTSLMHNPDVMPTYKSGIALKCSQLLERILQAVVRDVVPRCGVKGRTALESASGNGLLERLTMGELVLVLKRLRPSLKGNLPIGDEILDATAMNMLDSLVERRNRLIHEFLPRHLFLEETVVLLKEAENLCRSKLVRVLIDT